VFCPFAGEGMSLESDGYGGSGTVMTSEGMILTNSHVIPQTDGYIATPDEGCFVILYNPETGEDDIYLAEPIVIPKISEEYDLAYLSIYDAYTDEDRDTWGEYPRNFISFDDSLACDKNYINLGDEIRIYGYPVSSGGLSLTVTDGIVSSLPGDGTIFTSAKIDSGNSGGIAVDYNGCMIGVPVAVSEGEYENMGVIISTDLVYEFKDKLVSFLADDSNVAKVVYGGEDNDIDLADSLDKKNTIEYIDVDIKESYGEGVAKYGAGLILIGGYGSKIVQDSAYLLDEHGYLNPSEEWVPYFFNTPADILTAECIDGYNLILCESNTNNEVWTDDDLEWCRMIIEDKLQNRMNIECHFKDEASSNMKNEQLIDVNNNKSKIIIYNNYEKDQFLVSTTRVIAPDNKIFRISNTVTVPANSSAAVDLYSDDGYDFDYLKNSKFTIPGLRVGLQDDIYGMKLE
jgi:hypothetical protein